MTACIGDPISWLRLERFALGAMVPPTAASLAHETAEEAAEEAAEIEAHVAACPACRSCLEQIRGDVVELLPLVMPEAPAAPTAPARPAAHSARRRWWLAPALTAAAALVLLLLLWPPGQPPEPRDRVAVKGIGEVSLELVRERGGAIAFGARGFAPGDRWKVVISCPPSAAARIEVEVSDGAAVDHPLAPARIACGNRIVVPGAFTVTGERANRVCARIRADDADGAARGATDADTGTACVTLIPEPR